MSEKKITDLETAIAHHEMIISELSDIVNAQWKDIELLKKQLHKTNDKIAELESTTSGAQADVKPPHW